MLSLAQVSTPPTPSFALFDGLASAVGCKQAPGATRLACLREVSASAIRTVTNGPSSGFFGPSVDKYASLHVLRFNLTETALNIYFSLTFFSDPLQRIRTGLTARVPFIIGNTQDDGTLSAFNMTDLAAFLVTIFGSFPTADEVRSLYPSGLNDNAIISEAFRDFGNLWSVVRDVRYHDKTTQQLKQSCRALGWRRRGCGSDECISVYIWYGHIRPCILVDS
jgi:carboxylesterase type B